MSTTPIGDYALLSDRHSAALASRRGSIDWLCFPRFDSPSVFGRLLDDRAGHGSLCPRGVTAIARRYLNQTMVLETTYRTESGTAETTSRFMAEPGAAGVRPVPNWIEHPDPGGVNCTIRKVSVARSASSRHPRPS